MLPRRFRLTKHEFEEVRNSGRLVSGRLMGVLVLEAGSPAEALARAGIIVSKKLSKKATIRNQLKRRLRVALRHVLPELHPQLHLVVLPNHRSLDASVEELEKEIQSIIQKTK